MDLAKEVTCRQSYTWDQTPWEPGGGYGRLDTPRFNVVAMDFGAKQNILRSLAGLGCRVTVVPATASAEDVLRHRPDGIFLSNGPGDPAATGEYAVPVIRQLLKFGVPMFGICLGHQLLSIALGARTEKMHLGHRGANHPVKDLATGQVSRSLARTTASRWSPRSPCPPAWSSRPTSRSSTARNEGTCA